MAIGYNLVAADEVPDFQYRQVGPWRSYAFGEKAYLVLSLVATSALAWQIFAGSLAS